MGDVTPLYREPDEPHQEGPCLCMSCRHEWHGVAPAGTVDLECPKCGTQKGVWIHPCFHANRPHWQCKCGNEFFTINDDRFVCAACGTMQRFG